MNWARLWLQSIERNMKGKSKIGVFLSGGLDSRAIVSAINSKYYPIHTVTFGKKDCDDYRIARKVCRALGVKNHFVEISADTWFSTLEKTVYISEGNLNVIHQHSWDCLDIAKTYFDISLNGFAGDLVAGGSYLMRDFFYTIDSEKYYNKIFSKMNNWGIPIENEDKFYSSGILNDLCGLSKESLKKEIKKQKRSDYFFLNNRVRKFTLRGLLTDLTKIESRIPFFDNDFIDFVYGLPDELRFDHHIYNKMLLNFFPKTFLYIPWQQTGLTIGTGKLMAKMYQYYKGGKYIINKSIRWAGLPALFKDNINYVDYDNWMRVNRELCNYISDVLLKGKILDRGYFNQDNIKNIIDRHMQGKENNSQIIGLLLTFELFNRMFIDEEK
jgi:asparagine synthase (glutamine-hydrolysing)